MTALILTTVLMIAALACTVLAVEGSSTQGNIGNHGELIDED